MKTIIGLYVRLVYLYRALKQIRQPHLGDKVTYKGQKWFLNQGVCAPYWDLVSFGEESLGGMRTICANSVHEGQFKLQPLYRRFWFSFRFTYRFYMQSWYSIDVRNGISTSRKIVKAN